MSDQDADRDYGDFGSVGSDHYKDVAQSHRHLLDTLKLGNEDLFVKEVETHVKKAGSNLMQIAK